MIELEPPTLPIYEGKLEPPSNYTKNNHKVKYLTKQESDNLSQGGTIFS